MPSNRLLEDAVEDVEARYVAANPSSLARFEKARRVMPGGNTRTILHYDPFPVAIRRGEGTMLTDLDGHEYTDMLGEYSAGLYGHSEPAIARAVSEALADGTALGGPNRYELPLAEAFCARFPSVERIRFCNSGTEANLIAIQLARAATGRRRVIVLDGGYHGGLLYFQEGATAMNVDLPVTSVRLNDAGGLLDAARAIGRDLAAIILEPLMGGGGVLPAERTFLEAARAASDATGAVLIFDEVMTSRLGHGGLQQVMGVTPDLTTFGKYLGGGLSFGAVGGAARLMDRFDPAGPEALPHSGTFNNNSLMMAAGLAGLTEVLTEAAIARVNALGDRLRQRLDAVAAEAGVPLAVTGRGSMLGLHFQRTTPKAPHERTTPQDWRKLVHLELLLMGFYTGRRGFVTLMLPSTDAQADAFADAMGAVLRRHRPIAEAVLE